ncbi:MAG: hypothetical protein E5V94_02900 [Mesorhizobium sp.]|nr:MAG: hypothetical protein E5V94_02900 [Mesorhizobium sp.]
MADFGLKTLFLIDYENVLERRLGKKRRYARRFLIAPYNTKHRNPVKLAADRRVVLERWNVLKFKSILIGASVWRGSRSAFDVRS